MSGTLFTKSGGGFRVWTAGVLFAALFAAASQAEPVSVTLPQPSSAPAAAPAAAGTGNVDGAVVPASCASCSGGGLLGLPPTDLGEVSGCSSCGCGSNGCVPGRKPCDCCCDATDGPGRFLCGLYQCICCPDPCYDPHWCALADSAFGQTSGPRPITQMNLRYEQGWNMPFPDKSEFFMARADGKGKGPMQTVSPIFDNNLATYRELHMYNEAAVGPFSAWVDVPYENVSFKEYNGAAGLGDLSFGTKSMLLDCELLQFTFEFNTFTPTGNFTRGLGTGHVSLEPGFLMALKLAPETFLQSELAYRFPLGGDQAFEGPVFHYHLSLNQLLCHCGHDIQLIGTAEFNGWQFTGGEYTGPGSTTANPLDLAVSSSPVAEVFNMGPGMRLVICDKIDFGVAGFFNVSSGSIAKELLEAEFRWRF